MINEISLIKGIDNYLKNNIKSNEKILISISCGLDSTVLFNLIFKSDYLNTKNIYFIIFDHQKRVEGKFEIKQFIKFYNLSDKNIFIHKLHLKNISKGFQKKSRSQRYEFLYKFCLKKSISNIFLGHHLDDLNETFFLRKIQQSGYLGLTNIFLKNYKKIQIHRPLSIYTKDQIRSYANRKKLIWFEDRSNFELDFTRNKIRYFLSLNKCSSILNKDRLLHNKTLKVQGLYLNFFKRRSSKIYEIEIEKFNNLNKNLKFLVIQSFYYHSRHIIRKQIRDENIWNLLKILKTQFKKNSIRSVFSGKVRVLNKKICLNLS